MGANNPPTRLGIVGCGQMVVEGHLPVLAEMPEISVVGLVDLATTRAERLADSGVAGSDAVAYPDIATLLKSAQPDAVLIATPPSARVAEVTAVVSSGSALLLEKPIASTLAAADEIVHIVEDMSATAMMVHNYAFFDEYTKLFELAGNGAIGDVTSVCIRCLGAYPWQGAPEYRPGWRYDAAISGGGRLLDTGLHGLYLLEMLAGSPPTAVTATADFITAGIDRQCFALFEHGDVTVEFAVGEGHGPVHVEVRGSEGRLQLAFDPAFGDYSAVPDDVVLFREGGAVQRWPVAARSMVTPDLYREFLARRAAPDGGSDYHHSVRHARDLLATVTATMLSALMRSRLDLPLPTLSDDVYRDGVSAWSISRR